MQIHFTARAFLKTDNIYRYSLKNWGQKVADKYLVDINDAAFDLLKTKNHRKFLSLYLASAREHYLVYDIFKGHIIVADILSQRQDVETRLAEILKEIKEELAQLRERIKRKL